MNGVTLITCTGGRPESLARCAKYVARFENPDGINVQWLVVDDYIDYEVPIRTSSTYDLTFMCPRDVVWKQGMNTLASNLLVAIECVKYDAVMFIEDDDFYRADYMREQLMHLRNADIAGENPTRYYHVPSSQWCEMRSLFHASLCQTAMRSTHLHILQDACREAYDMIDVRLWAKTSHLRQTRSSVQHVVGMKGLPGRPGIGVGHKPDANIGWKPDIGCEKLREWLGDDADLYVGPKYAPEAARNRAQPRQDASERRT